MSAVIDVALPVFAIMAAGLLAGRMKLLGTEAALALNAFVYWFALPPLLFLGLAKQPLADVLNGPFIAAFLTAQLGVALLGMLVAWLGDRCTPMEALVQRGLNACFANTGYMGIPLFLAAFGPPGLGPVILATILVSSVTIGLSVVGIELCRARGSGVMGAVRKVGGAILRNPLVMAPLAGLIASALSLPLPRPVVTFGELLGAAAGPCALFAIGLFLAGQRLRGAFTPDTLPPLVLKLLLHPALAWVLVTHVWPLPPFWAGASIILAALPTGALTFVVAQRYGIEVERTGAVILVSTLASTLTLSALLVVMLPLSP